MKTVTHLETAEEVLNFLDPESKHHQFGARIRIDGDDWSLVPGIDHDRSRPPEHDPLFSIAYELDLKDILLALVERAGLPKGSIRME